jgi:hypothetical protein
MEGWIGVDLDGTLAHYDQWRGIEHIGAPISSMVGRVKEWINAGKDVRIFTARVDGGSAALAMGDKRGELYRDVDVVKSHIEQWCQTHLGTILPITNVKDFSMLELWDDRCVQVERNTGRRADGLE